MSLIQPYLFFNGRCDEAIALYQSALGAEVVMLMRHKYAPEPPQMALPPGTENKVMHATLNIGGASATFTVSGVAGAKGVRVEGYAAEVLVAARTVAI